MVCFFLKVDCVFLFVNLCNINMYFICFLKFKIELMKEIKNFLGICVGDFIIFDMFRIGFGIVFRL